jgi:hypothetical protein
MAYSILTHEAVIDAVWDSDLAPLLRQRYPGLDDDDLRRARAHAYGGALIQDLGYYPFSNRLFTDLTHYVRTGAFVAALLDEAQDADEFAFALGALAHYTSDIVGHPGATNLAVALYSPKLERRYGRAVVFEQDPMAHIRAEFGFDVVQAATGRYASKAYHDFVGFAVAAPVLERAFRRTYDLDLAALLGDEERTIRTYRHTASQLFPKVTELAWLSRADDIKRAVPEATRDSFVYRLGPSEYERHFGAGYSRPRLGKRIVVFLYRLVPKIGPLKPLAFKPATAETERLFVQSLEETVARYRAFVAEAFAGTLVLEDRDLDSGRRVAWGESGMTQRTYARLLEELARNGLDRVPPATREDILAYFDASDGTAPASVKPKQWRETLVLVDRLRVVPPPRSR